MMQLHSIPWNRDDIGLRLSRHMDRQLDQRTYLQVMNTGSRYSPREGLEVNTAIVTIERDFICEG